MELSSKPVSTAHRRLALLLKITGYLDLLALGAVLFPHAFISVIHQGIGLGEFPDHRLAWYLTRSASLLYALLGTLLIYFAADVQRYLPAIRLVGRLLILAGAALLGIDLFEEMPVWWTLVEGPVVASLGCGIVVLAQQATDRCD